MTARIDRVYGYNEETCIECTNGNNQYPREKVQFKNYKVRLPSKCTYAYRENPNAPGPITYVHEDANKYDKLFDNGFEKFFINDDKANCPVRSCKIMKKGCAIPHDGGDGNNISMESSSPWKVTVKDNQYEGYEDESCVVCESQY